MKGVKCRSNKLIISEWSFIATPNYFVEI